MWKSFVNALIASCVACDPMVHMYWRTVLLEAEHQPQAEPERPLSRNSSQPRLHLVRGPSEASA